MLTLREISELVKGELSGNPQMKIFNVRSAAKAGEGDICYLDQKHYGLLADCRASAVLIGSHALDISVSHIKVDNPRLAFITLLEAFHVCEFNRIETIHQTAVIADNAHVGSGVMIGPNAVIESGAFIGNDVTVGAGSCIGRGVYIGEKTKIGSNVTIHHEVMIGKGVIIESGTVIGADGFGFEWDGTRHVKIPHVGTVVIEDDVEVGANTTIDRGTLDETRIGCGTKIGNLVQIGHNVQIGENCIIVDMAGIAGSAKIGNQVTVAARAGIAGHIAIGDHCTILALSGVTKNLPPHSIVSGFPAIRHEETLRNHVALKKMLSKRKELEG